MTDYLSKYRNTKKTQPKVESSESVLTELSEQIFKEFKDKGLFSYVGTSHGHGDGFMIITLNLMSGNTNNQYFYRLIEIEQPVDQVYNVKIRSYQNPPTEWKEISSAEELETEIIEIMGDPRFQVIVEMVSQMGKTIDTWNGEK